MKNFRFLYGGSMLVEYGHAFLTAYPETLFGIPEQGSNLLDVDWRSVIFLSDGGKTPFFRVEVYQSA